MKYSYFGIMKKDYPIDNDYLCSMWPDYIVMTVCITLRGIPTECTFSVHGNNG